MKWLTSRRDRGANVSQELSSKPFKPEDKKLRKMEETCKQRRKEISE